MWKQLKVGPQSPERVGRPAAAAVFTSPTGRWRLLLQEMLCVQVREVMRMMRMMRMRPWPIQNMFIYIKSFLGNEILTVLGFLWLSIQLNIYTRSWKQLQSRVQLYSYTALKSRSGAYCTTRKKTASGFWMIINQVYLQSTLQQQKLHIPKTENYKEDSTQSTTGQTLYFITRIIHIKYVGQIQV